MYSILYFLLMILIGYLLGRNRKKLGFDGAYSGIMVGFFICYALVPFLLHTFSDYYLSQTNWKYWYIHALVYGSSVSDWDIILSIICIIIGLYAFNLGYGKTVYIGRIQLGRVYSGNDQNDEWSYFDKKIIKRIALAVLIGCIVLLGAYVMALGGLQSAFAVSDALRSHTINVSNYGVSGIYSYVFLVCGLLPLSFALLWCVHKQERRFISFFMLAISAVATFIYLRLNSGKSGFIRFGIIISYLLCGKKLRKHYWMYVLVGGILLLPLLDVLDLWFSGATIQSSALSYDILGNIVSFESPVELNYNLCEITGKYGYQFFKHYILDFLDVLPGISFDTSWECVSEFVRGSDWMLKGGTPNDIITYGFLQFNILGVFIHLFVVGQIAAFTDKCTQNINERFRNVVAICFCSCYISLVSCSDISSTFLHNLFFTGLLVFIIYMNSKWKKRERGS